MKGDGHKKNMDNASNKISLIRSHTKLSLSEFGKRVGISAMTVSRIEKGESIPRVETIDNICRAFNLSEEYFEEHVPAADIEQYISSTISDLRDDVKNPYDAESEVAKKRGDRLREIRNERGYSIKQLSEASGVRASLISNIEHHDKNLTEKQGRKLAEALEVGIDWLLYGDEEKKHFPVDERLIEWLWKHEDIRKNIRDMMADNTECGTQNS